MNADNEPAIPDTALPASDERTTSTGFIGIEDTALKASELLRIFTGFSRGNIYCCSAFFFSRY
jgi:hypothetical protein